MAETWSATRRTAALLALLGAVGVVVRRASPRSSPLPAPESVRSILVTELWNIGDVVLTLPFLAELRRIFPRAAVTLLGKSHARDVLQGTGLVDEFIAHDLPWTAELDKYRARPYRGLVGLVRELRRRSFDMSFDCRMDARGNLLTRLSGARYRVGYARGGAEWLLTHGIPADDLSRHKSDDWLRLLEPFAASGASSLPALNPGEPARRWADAFLRECGLLGQTLIGIHPGASRAEKRWPEAQFERVIRALASRPDVDVLVFVDPAGTGRELAERTGVSHVRPSLPQLMALLERCNVLVCNDSGPMHLAGGLGTRTVAIFGAGMADWFAPLGKGHVILTRRELECRPCYAACRFEEMFCLTGIAPANVLAAVDSVLSEAPAPLASAP